MNRDTVCNVAAVHNGRALETMICAGSVAANAGAICDSTRGGGIYCNGNFTGIASSGFGCGVVNTPGLFTQVSYEDRKTNYYRHDVTCLFISHKHLHGC